MWWLQLGMLFTALGLMVGYLLVVTHVSPQDRRRTAFSNRLIGAFVVAGAAYLSIRYIVGNHDYLLAALAILVIVVAAGGLIRLNYSLNRDGQGADACNRD